MAKRLLILVTMIGLARGERGVAQEKPPQALVIDAKGKEVALKSYTFAGGTMHLWVDDKTPADKKNGPRRGPECLAFREDKSTTYQNGIVTLVPLSAIRAIDYDSGKKTVVVTLLADGKEQALTGSTKFKDINKLTLEAEADLGALGVAAVKFHGGALADGIRGLRFPRPEPLTATPAKRRATIVAADKEKHAVADIVPVYRFADGSLRTAPTLFFKTTVKIDIAKVKGLKHMAPDSSKQSSLDFKVMLDDGAEHTLTLLTKVDLDAGKGATLVGLGGRVVAGYKLFPPHTIAEATFEAAKSDS